MKDPILPVSNAYLAALDNISVGGNQIPFYRVVPESANNEYTYISAIRAEEEGDKSSFGAVVNVEVTVVTDDHGSHGRIDNSEDISDKVVDNIKNTLSSKLDLSPDGFLMVTSRMLSSELKPGTEKSKGAIKRVIKFRHDVEQT